MYAHPIVAAGHVIAATENDTVEAVDPATGHVVWSRHLGTPTRLSQLPCGNIDPLGITGTPAYDPGTGSVFVVTETGDAHHTLVALDAATGTVRWRRDLDVGGRDRYAQQQRAALLVAGNRVYVAFGGLYGDCGNYVGYVVAAPTGGAGSLAVYAVPTAREGGIWAASGPTLGPGGDIYVSVGNGAATSGSYDGSDAVVRLTPSLGRLAFFAPSSWPSDNANDADLGSMAPAVVGDRLVIAGKRGIAYLLSPSLRGIGGQLTSIGGCAGYGGAAVSGDLAVMPCDAGLRALRVSGDSLAWSWQDTGITGTPTVAGSRVYAFDRGAGDLVVISLASGRIVTRRHVGPVTHFASPLVVGGTVVVGTTSRLVAVVGLT
jgi:PQQ-like domain